MIRVTVNNRGVQAIPLSPVTVGAEGIVAAFLFSDDWAGLAKTAIFKGSDEEVEMIILNNECTVPPEVLTEAGGMLMVGVYGNDGHGTLIRPTVWGVVGRIEDGAISEDAGQTGTTPSWAAQVQNAVQEAITTANNAVIAAEENADDSEAWAVGTRDGEAIPETDPAYQNYAKCWAERAAASATEGAESAATASGKANEAAASAGTASNKAGEAATSAGNAAASAEAANTAKTAAQNAQTAAEQAKAGAETARDASSSSAGQAAESATQAAGSASDAAQSATAAQGSESAAATSAQNAAASETAAATSARNAGNSASAAATSETNAANSATAAAGSAGNAATSEQNASASATAAANSVTAAQTAQSAAEDAQGAAETAAASVSSSAAQIAQNTSDISELNRQLSDISNKENIVDTSSNVSKIISDSGEWYTSSKYSSVVFACKPNTKYAIKNPDGNRLYVGCSTTNSTSQTLPDYYMSADVTKCVYTTISTAQYIFINYYNANKTGSGAATALGTLECIEVSANDVIARESIEEINLALQNKAPIAALTALQESPNLYNPDEHYWAGYYINNNGAWSGPGETSYDVIGYIPVHGFEYITVMLECVSGAGQTGQYAWYNQSKQIIGSKQGEFPVYGNKYSKSIAVPEGAYYIAINIVKSRVKYDDNGKVIASVQPGALYTGYEQFGVYRPNPGFIHPKDVFVVAHDSEEKYRVGADYVCMGANDEITLQNALNAVGQVGTLWLAPGTYKIDSFPEQTDGQHTALQYKVKVDGVVKPTRVRIKCFDQTPMRENGYSNINHCATLVVSSACYSELASDTQYSVIGVENDGQGDRVWNGACFDISGVGIQIPGNQKKVIAFDAWYAFCIMMERCMATAIQINAMPSAAGDEDCIGIKCTKGSNFGQCSQLTSCAMYGFGQGIAVSGEHYVLTNCKTIYNKYGYTFNWYGDNNAGYTHPNTLINCCSEMDFNYPYFGYNGQVSSVTLIDFNMEYRNASAALGGELAQERIPGTWRGSINYTIKTYGSDGYASGNNVTFPFWKSGHGANVKTINDAQKQIVTTTERESYAANEMQRVYDSTAGKFFTYVNGAWVEG